MEICLGNEYKIHSYNLKDNGREKKVDGYFYKKLSDVTIEKNGKIKGVISYKFVASNYRQNTNNYFENLLGECVNIAANAIPFCHIFAIRNNPPYFEEKGIFKENEKIKEHHLEKYFKLEKFKDKLMPSKIAISILDISGDTIDKNILSDETYHKLNKEQQKMIKNEYHRIHPTLFDKLNKDEQNELCEKIKVKSLTKIENFSKNKNKQIQNLEINKIINEFVKIVKEKD